MIHCAVTSRWSGQGAFHAPAVPIDTLTDRPRVDSRDLGPLSRGARYSIERQGSTALTIPCLVGASSPAAITRSVGAVIVDSIDRMHLRRPLAHIGRERFKGIAPSIANNDSPAAISRVRRIPRVAAPLNDERPCAMQVISSSPMASIGSRNRFFPQTAATARVSASQSISDYSCETSASTGAVPVDSSRSVRVFPFYGQSAKQSTRQIVPLRHGNSFGMVPMQLYGGSRSE